MALEFILNCDKLVGNTSWRGMKPKKTTKESWI